MKLENILNKSDLALALICGLMFGLSGCGDKEEQPQASVVVTHQSPAAQQAPIATSQPAQSDSINTDAAANTEVGMPAAAKRNNCTACHSINKRIVGPAWMAVSMKYKGADKFEYNGKEYPLVQGLIMKVSQGGSGHWGSMPMPANDYKGVKQAEIKELVQFVLGLAK
jgi:cytochrome c